MSTPSPNSASAIPPAAPAPCSWPPPTVFARCARLLPPPPTSHDEDDEAALALCLVEDVLWGYDINLTATHMAASALGMLSPRTQFNKMRIYRTYLGVYGGVPYLGSLEFLEGQARLIDWPQLSSQVDDDSAAQPPEQPPAMDLVIMNPPFTVDRLRHNQLGPNEKKSMGERERRLFDSLEAGSVVDMTANSGAFAVLAEHLLKAKSGSIAMVMPGMIPTAPSGAGIRKYLADRFHIDTIVSSHDPQRIYFSENTDIGEVLIVCRRSDSNTPKPPTRVVNLVRNPSTPIEALNVLSQMRGGASSDLTEQLVDAVRMGIGDWNAVNFLSPFLTDAFRSLADAATPLLTLSDIAEIGPHRRRPHEAFSRSDLPTSSGRQALWFHKTDITQSMRAKPDSHLEQKEGKRSMADRYWEQRSRLLIANRLWLPSARVGAVLLDYAVLGSLWTPCRTHDGNLSTMKALAVYLNSTVGILSLLGGRDNRKPSYPQFSLDTLRSLRVPDFAALGNDARDALAATYDRLQDEVLLPLPQMNEDPVRKQLDDAVIAALDLDPEWVAQVRQALSEEPSVTNRRFGS
ncbi:MAG: SAM-dependent DNA methyltransferase [Chloroflexi bacterium]|nr:SAM-dependent DNA methyltransferase [Chloroflexota bacterium]